MRKMGQGNGPAAGLAAAVMVALALVGCSTMDSMFGEPSPQRSTTGAHPTAKGDSDSEGAGEQAAKAPETAEPRESGGFFDRMFGSMFGEPSPQRSTTGAHPMAESKTIPGEDKPYPNVASVPSTPATSPEAEREKMVQGLVADRADARYTDETLRRQEPQPAPLPMPAKRPEGEESAVSRTAVPPSTAALPMPDNRREPTRTQSAMVPEPVPAAPPAPAASEMNRAPAAAPSRPPAPTQYVTTMAPIPSPGDSTGASGQRLATSPPPRANPAAGIAGPAFGPPPADIDLVQNQFAAAGPAGMDGAESSFRVATVNFGAGSTSLDSSDERALRRVVQLYKRQGGKVTVVGHSSSLTRDMAPVRHQMVNFSLSLERAQAVARALERMGVPTDSIEVAALSDAQPVYYESMPAGEAANRRAEVFLRQ